MNGLLKSPALKLVSVAFVLFFIITDPVGLADILKQGVPALLELVAGFFEGLITFVEAF